MNHAHPSVNADEVVYNLTVGSDQPLEFPNDEEECPISSEEPEIELKVLSGKIRKPRNSTEYTTTGCMGFLRQTWKKFTEIRQRDDDLDSLELYYLINDVESIAEKSDFSNTTGGTYLYCVRIHVNFNRWQHASEKCKLLQIKEK